jgi:hypothetical protein
MTDHPKPPPGMITSPSHVTRAQAARILGRHAQTVYHQSVKGGPLETEDWWGARMIPVYRVMAELEKQREKK